MSNSIPTALALVGTEQIPLWLKISVTVFVGVLVPVYWRQYGPGNFLWFSDIALLMLVPTLWLESAFLASMIVISVGVLELMWIVDFLARLIAGVSVTGLSGYMFDSKILLSIRALSLFHIALPLIVIWIISRLGYDGRALLAQTLLTWIVLPLSYFLTDRSENVNWVYGFSSQPQKWMSPGLYLALIMLLIPLVIYLPTHLVLRAIFE